MYIPADIFNTSKLMRKQTFEQTSRKLHMGDEKNYWWFRSTTVPRNDRYFTTTKQMKSI